ncbi:L-lactate MFS transporter [Jeotgalibaca ciconiae]|uniref:MFS transporter n=1 Tax=Jeotgalibaca ciconiae TaxID=2496265 RepID=A0A3Q9BKY2_9LACT|nr:OFA family MFS transporter [Jeotgalibaca ciconiae]AZP04821.1 MFS transporter [Jeotgalibaca ciconiae]
MNQNINRWQVLAASTAVLLCTGAIYAFSVFAGPLSALKGWSMAEIMLAFTINSAISPIPMILGGFLTDKGWSKATITLGGLLFGLGFFLTGLATTPAMLYLTYGVIGGIGQGLAYSGGLSNTIKLFPDKKGLASGIITAGMGGAAIIAAPIGNYLIESYDVASAFRILGVVYLVIVAAASFFIKAAPIGYQPAGWTPPVQEGKNTGSKNWQQMLQSPYFYLIFFMLFTGAFSGLMIASNAAVIGQEMFGLTAAISAFYVSLYSFSNCTGRVVWGTISDKLGRNNTLNIIFGMIIVAFVLLVIVSSPLGFAIGIIILGLCFGGVMGVFAPLVMENFGALNQGVNYGIVFCGYSAAALFGPRVATSMASANNGNFTNAFYVAILIALVGLVLNVLYIQMKKAGQASLGSKKI